MSDDQDQVAALSAWFANLLDSERDREAAVDEAFQKIENAGLVNRIVVHRYLCKRGCKIATVVKLGDLVLCRTRDYKWSPGPNEAWSVPRARERNTLDGNRHWPGHTYDVTNLATWGPDAGFDLICRHVKRTELAADVLAVVVGVQPGHPGKPTLL